LTVVRRSTFSPFPERPRVTRLSRKTLASGTALALLLISGAVLWALQKNRAH